MNLVLAEIAIVIIYKQDTDGNFIYTGPYIDHYTLNDHMNLSPNKFYPQASQ
jgi:hypothetical protein